MKKFGFLIFLMVSMSMTFSACNNSTPNNTSTESKSTGKIVYTCTMHPEVRSDKPGNCPKCGMQLVKMDTSDSTHLNNETDSLHRMK